MKKYHSSLWISGIILFIILITPFGLYIKNFHASPISKNPADWGTFGDFLGGSINSVMAVVNIFVLLYLTFRIAAVEGERNDQAIALQEKLALNQIRLDAYRDVNAFFLKLNQKMMYDKNFGNHEYHTYKVEFHMVLSPYLDLFKCLEPDRLNQIGEMIFDVTNLGQDVEDNDHGASNLRKTYISAHTKLLNDMRAELHR